MHSELSLKNKTYLFTNMHIILLVIDFGEIWSWNWHLTLHMTLNQNQNITTKFDSQNHIKMIY